MFSIAVDFANLMMAALVVGAMLGLWLGFNNPTGMDAAAYITQHQRAVRGSNTVMPILGGIALLLTLLAALLAQRERLALLLLGALGLLGAGLVTRFLNQPINARMMTWSPSAPPAEWTTLRDRWWRWHLVRFAAGLIGLAGVIAAALQRGLAA